MNILRWKRKSKKKIKFKSLILIIFSLIMTTFAWFTYSKILNPELNLHISSWDMQYFIGEEEKTNPIGVQIPTIYPAMDEQTVTIDIKNNGETLIDVEYSIQALTIAGIQYELVQEGANPTNTNYIVLGASVLESRTVGTGETEDVYIYKNAVTSDITKIPFTIEIEHSAQVKPVTKNANGEKVPGEGYLKITVNWIGDNDELDSQWGYVIGEYLNSEEATSAISMQVTIESYQAEGPIQEIEHSLPSTSETVPYLPTGFSKLAGTNLDNGLVIKDESGNEYVWIEVPKTSTVYANSGLGITAFSDTDYANIESDLKTYTSTYRTRDDAYPLYQAIGISESNYNTLKQKMLKSIYQNGGFYIGRYETGIADSYRTSATTGTPTETPIIQAHAYPYNWVTCSQAQTLAGRMESGDYTSSLMFGVQWDLVLKYFETKGTDTSVLKTDSSTWGNYSNTSFYVTNLNSKYNIYDASTKVFSTWASAPYDKVEDSSVLLNTGANSTFCKQNIYDFAGNLSEWTLNIIYSNSIPIGGSGGDFSLEGANTANYKGEYNSTKATGQVGFRVTIF